MRWKKGANLTMSLWKKIFSKIKTEKKISELIREKNQENSDFFIKKQKRFDEGLNKSANKFANLIQILSKKYTKIDESLFDDIFDLLVSFDVGYTASQQIIDACKEEVKLRNVSNFDEIKEILVGKLFAFYIHDTNINVSLNLKPNQTNVFLIVGTNGVGKTSTIAKIANLFIVNKKKVLLVAGDTFRAAACEQLEQWAKKINCDIVLPKSSQQDCASVIYDGVKKGVEEHYDLVICDTSGRQQNKKNLMNELTKIQKVIAKFVGSPVDEILLVVDATTGQTGLKQANAFNEATKITGIVLTKLDSSAKGGIIFAIKEILQIPVKLICFGETVNDIAEFELDKYVLGLVSSIENYHKSNRNHDD